MQRQVPIHETARADFSGHHGLHPVAADLAYQRLAIVNVVLFGTPGAPDRGWVLVDAGITGSAGVIERAARDRFGEGSRPSAIVQTHGHFDHVGALRTLSDRWDAPIYAHPEEMPYLDGRRSYPAPDPSVGGLMATLSVLFPRGPLELGDRLRALPADGSVPGMPGWVWVHTPGHTPGHVSLWREADGALIAGDAFITTRQESAYAVATQEPELHGPPMYFTPDWARSADSVRRLAALGPELAVTGHGRAMHGPALRRALQILADDFEHIAVPPDGRYAHTAHDRAGSGRGPA